VKSFDRIKANISRNRLFKNPDKGLLFGVCAGLGDYVGVPALAVRIVAVLALLWWGPTVAVAYLIGAFILNARPKDRWQGRMDRMRERHDRWGRSY